MNKKCLNCGNDFEPLNPKGKYCSDKCRVYGNRKKKVEDVKEKERAAVNLKESIQSQIQAIRNEKIPEHRNTSLGRKVWQQEQQQRISELQKLLNPPI